MFNVQQTTSRLAEMSDAQLAQYAAMHKSDPYVLSLASSESNRRKELRNSAQAQMAGMKPPTVADQTVAGMEQDAQQEDMPHALPEERGIGRLPAQNIAHMADGGIAGYADGGSAIDQYAPQIVAEAKRLGIDPKLALRMFTQESKGDKSAISPKGAAGLGQLMKSAAKDMGISEEDRFDPSKNITASLGYLKKQLNQFKDPVKAVAAYNWGPGNLKKHLAKNNGEINPVGLPKETADYINKLLPIGAANAAETTDEIPRAQPATKPATAPATAPVAAKPATVDSSVPTAENMAAEAKRRKDLNPERGWWEQRGRELLGAPEAIASAFTGAPPINAVAGGLRSLVTGEDVNTAAERMRFEPRSEYGKESAYELSRALSDTGLDKLPPFMPGIGVPKPRGLLAKPKATPKNFVDAAKAADEALNKQAFERLPPPSSETPGVVRVTPEGEGVLPTGEAAARETAALNNWEKDVAAAKATDAAKNKAGRNLDENVGRATTNKLMNERAAEQARIANGVSLAAPFAASRPGEVYPGVAAEGPAVPFNVSTGASGFPVNPDIGGETAPETFEGTTQAPAEETKPAGSGFSNEDILTMGLNMMQARPGQGGGALSQLASNIGTSGIATLAARKEREKMAQDQAYKDTVGQYYKAMGENAQANAAYTNDLKSETALRTKAAGAIETALAEWNKQNFGASPEQQIAARNNITQAVFRNLGLSQTSSDPRIAGLLKQYDR